MIECIKVNTCIVGTGAAGYNAACRLKAMGEDDILLISENRLGGTSRNTGSDKQTYYKLSLAGDSPDSVGEMARTLFEGKAVDGDIALCEAALSTRSIMHLVEAELPFPTNMYGEYVGYKTDHDPRTRATSIGPYTSREMTRALEKESSDVPFRDHLQVISILSDGKRCYGLLCLDNSCTDKVSFVAIQAANVIFATGGPAGMYRCSVYPESQHGASGISFEAGVKGRNLTEWQFGLASVHPRWNVSGTYMQALPRFVSTAEDGSDEKEFLPEYFDSPEQMLSMVFLKGYQFFYPSFDAVLKGQPAFHSHAVGKQLPDTMSSLDEYCEEVRRARRDMYPETKLWASVGHYHDIEKYPDWKERWKKEAREVVAAGADAIELHFNTPGVATASDRQFNYYQLVATCTRMIKKEIPGTPVMVKLAIEDCDCLTSISAFNDTDKYYSDVDSRIRELKSSKLAKGSRGILMPGEIEALRFEASEASGLVDVLEENLNMLNDVALEMGVKPIQTIEH